MKPNYNIGDAIVMPSYGSFEHGEHLYGIILNFKKTTFEYHDGMYEYEIFWFDNSEISWELEKFLILYTDEYEQRNSRENSKVKAL